MKKLMAFYLTSLAFVLTGSKPLVIAGAFFGICYLPGLALFSILKKDELRFEDIILSFPVSVGISSLTTLIFLYLGVHVKFIIYIVYGFVGCLILLYGTIFRKAPLSSVKLSRREIRFLILALLATLIFSYPVLSDRIVISAHGFHHSSLSTQIVNGIFPPENPGMGGTSISYHWGYHAFVAALSSPSNLPPLVVMSLLNIISLYFIFCIAYRTATCLDLAEGYSYLVVLALIGLMRSDAAVFLINKLSSGALMDLRQITFPEVRPSEILQSWIWGGGAPWFDRRLLFINKFYNANTMPIGIAICLSYFMVLLIHTIKRNRGEYNKIYPITIGLILIAGCITYPPLAIIALLHAPVWAFISLLLKKPDLKAGLREALQIAVPFCLAVLIVLPYLLSVSGNAGEPVIRIRFYDQSIINLVTFWMAMPVIVAGVFLSFKKLPSDIFYFLLAASSVCLGLSIFTQVMFGNSAKFTFVLSFFYAIYFVYAISTVMHWMTRQWLKRLFLACIIFCLLTTPVITEAAYIISPWFSDETYAFSGRHIIFYQDRKRNEAYKWIRENTPPDALLMLTYVETSNPDTIAQNSTYEPSALAERNLFVVRDWYTVSNPEYKKRIMIRKKLFSDTSYTAVNKYFLELNRPVYLLVEDTQSPFIRPDSDFGSFDFNSRHFQLVFTDGRQRIYRIIPR